MNPNTIELINQGLRCLSANLGEKETEIFISTLLRERFDYTKWRQSFVDSINTFEDLDNLIRQTNESAAFEGQADVVL